ncbi:MAG: TonB C-terminal domain-containing protein [Candidatus Saccharicenans sp.]|nr:TonB C-terminal domain-containing protein [Candidatus Saccharicenans sp.]
MKLSLPMSSSFRKAVILSLFFHAMLLALIGLSNQLAGPKKTGMVHYVNLNFVGLPGGGGGGGGGSGPGPGGAKPAQPSPAAQKETMKELTVPQKTPAGSAPSLRHPVEKARPASKKPASAKKTEISAPQPGSQAAATRGSESGQAGGTGTGGGAGGSGLRIGVGEGPGGFGGGYGDPLGTASFPFTYYLQIIIDRVSSNWFTATSNLDYSGEYQSVIYFKILRNGQVADLKIEQPSELPALDLTARRAVELAAPFPPLPRDFENDYLVVHLIFERSK